MTPSHERNPDETTDPSASLKGRWFRAEEKALRGDWGGLKHLCTCSKATRMSIQALVIHMSNKKHLSKQMVTEVPATVNTMSS